MPRSLWPQRRLAAKRSKSFQTFSNLEMETHEAVTINGNEAQAVRYVGKLVDGKASRWPTSRWQS